MTTCPDCAGKGFIDAPATRVHYGRIQGQIVAAKAGGPLVERSTCLVCPGPPHPMGDVSCEDCPPWGYPTDETRCTPCPRRGHPNTYRGELR